MDLEQALARIAELEGLVNALADARDAGLGRVAELEATEAGATATGVTETGAGEAVPGEAGPGETGAAEAGSGETGPADLADVLAEARARGLAHLRRALLAEHAGQVVPELVAGDSEEVLLASVDVAKQAYTRALDAARAALASQSVPAGAPSARTAATAGLTPLEMIESGLRS